MRKEQIHKTGSLVGASDLTIIAPIKKGFVPSLDAVTYKTRVKRVLKTLHAGRVYANEYEFARVLSDAVERVGRIHSIRIAILEPEDKVLLAVTFDGSWESYIRVIWQKVARSLDLIFCNTEDYVTGWEHSFEEWCVWLRKSQAESSFLYSPPGLTYQDTLYLRTFERRLRRDGSADLDATRIRIPTAEEISDQICKDGTDLTNAGLSQPVQPVPASRPAFRQGMRGLAGLYRLVDQHLPATGDDGVLHRAATELLREFRPMLNNPAKYQEAIARAETRFRDALDWFRDTPMSGRSIPSLPGAPTGDSMSDVQGGIVAAYPNISEGCLVLFSADTPLALAGLLGQANPTASTDVLGADGIAINIALTAEGLRVAGLTDDEFAALPAEFVQGMDCRAGMLGDLRINHPQRWRRPAFNWSQGIAASDVAQEDPIPRVNLAAVHLVLQLRLCNSAAPQSDARTRLLHVATQMVKAVPGVRALSIQWMHRLLAATGGGTREHFGFLDSQSQPVYSKAEAGSKYPNQVHLGEVLLGHDNAADTAPEPLSGDAIAAESDPKAMQLRNEMLKLMHNGSFLVIRKLRQDIGALEIALEEAVDAALPDKATPEELKAREDYRTLLLGKMMGRWPEASALPSGQPGAALVATFGKNDNDFNFNNDKQGSLCPFHAHIRRSNPRDTSVLEPPGARPARLFRRGMSYGPVHDTTASGLTKANSLAQERGLVFLAYNASIGEQFEVIQRWLAGGNSSGSYSGQSDPFLGIAEPGRQRFFRFEHANQSVRMHLDGSDSMHDEPRPIVRLEWGMYLFTPSLPAIQTLITRAKATGNPFAKSWSDELGEREITRLRRVAAVEGDLATFNAWKAALEDPASAADFTAASIWAAIRKNHGGVLDTPLGVLVASRELVDEVLLDSRKNLTATGYLPRMHLSFGGLYLGLDAGQIEGVYELESTDVNAAIVGLVADPADLKQAVDEAAQFTKCGLDVLARTAAGYAKLDCETHWEVTFDAREIIDQLLAHFCETWFGLSDDGKHLQKSGVRWNWKLGEPPCYPGHFMAPSRYTFQPHPSPEVEAIGAQHGVALRVAITKYLEACRLGPPKAMTKGKDILSKAKVAQAILNSAAAKADPGYPARTLAGVLMGFLPTTDGNIRRVLNEWLTEGTLWSLRAQFAVTDPTNVTARGALTGQLHKKFVQAMQLRAAPELLWRTAATSHTIGKPGADQVAVRPGQIVIASLISATQQCLEQGVPSLDYAFGGRREPPNAHPTHACPGYGPASAVMLGFFQGLVESGQALRAGPGPLSFYMDGYADLQPGCEASASSTLEMLAIGHPASDAAEFTALHAAALPLLVIGDSWLTDLGDFLYPASLASRLRRLGYRLDDSSESKDFRDIGKQLAQIADSTLLAEIGQYLADLQGTSGLPRAILIGAGGNDLVDPATRPESTKLFGMLNGNAPNAASALIEQKMKAFIDVTLFNHYVAILDVVTAATDASIPILIHGYDHPIPDGKKFEGVLGLGQRGPWLKSVFDEKNIPLSISQGVMVTLIDRLNTMLLKLETKYSGRVYHLKLTGTLASQPGFQQNLRKYWDNELHATAIGFDALAKVVQDKLVSLGVT